MVWRVLRILVRVVIVLCLLASLGLTLIWVQGSPFRADQVMASWKGGPSGSMLGFDSRVGVQVAAP